MSAIDFAALRREREARRGAPPPSEEEPSAERPAAAAASSGRRLDGEAVTLAEEPALKRQAVGSPIVWLGGAVKDSSGRHAQRPPPVPASAIEVDCRRSETEVRVQGNVARLSAGLGSLHDRKPTTDKERELVLAFLERDAREIDKALSRGESVWVHCAQGFNRGPSGLLAYLLLYTDCGWEEACAAVKAARPRARTHHNTFAEQLLELAARPKAGRLLADHTKVDIRDGGNDPADDVRR
jgi:hypothetical protein